MTQGRSWRRDLTGPSGEAAAASDAGRIDIGVLDISGSARPIIVGAIFQFVMLNSQCSIHKSGRTAGRAAA
jgi:hypothetical protein